MLSGVHRSGASNRGAHTPSFYRASFLRRIKNVVILADTTRETVRGEPLVCHAGTYVTLDNRRNIIHPSFILIRS